MGLAARMKTYEDNANVVADHYYVVRADGNTFSKFTTGLRKPFDMNFTRAMTRAANDVLVHFSAQSVFVCSDEISLVFDKVRNDNPAVTNAVHIYNGRKIKIATLVAAKCSVLFNKYMLEECRDDIAKGNVYQQVMVDKIQRQECIFDARVMEFTDETRFDIVNNLIWRANYDCHRNSVSTYGRVLLGAKRMHGLKSHDVIRLLKSEQNLDWSNDVDVCYRLGLIGKRELVEYVSADTGEKYCRARMVNHGVDLLAISKQYSIEQALDLLLAKYWPSPSSSNANVLIKTVVQVTNTNATAAANDNNNNNSN